MAEHNSSGCEIDSFPTEPISTLICWI
uniref:Uncharacterized protein n=1 Tax=Anguilla anguilla TaxID=7936 RepID=A0A0E9TCK3_ANGAN